MKKVNLINKKIMSTSLATSLLVASLGATPCSAYKTNNTVIRKISSSTSRASLTKKPSQPRPQSQPQLNSKTQNFTITKESVKTTNSTGTSTENSNNSSETDKEKVDTKNNLQISMSNSFEKMEKQKLAVSAVVSFENTNKEDEKETSSTEKNLVNKISNSKKVDLEIQTEKNSEVDTEIQIKNEKNISAQAKVEDKNNQEPQVNEDKSSRNKSETKKTNSISKKEMAKAAAKVVAAAAIVGAATYFGYKYRAPIAETLTKGGYYISDKASLVTNRCKSGFTTSKDYLANKANSFANSCKSGFTTSKDYLTNKANSIVDTCKNIFDKSKKSVKPLQMEYFNSSFINGTCPINQSELWKCPLEKQSLFKQLKNGIASKMTPAFKYIKSFLALKSDIDKVFLKNAKNTSNSVNNSVNKKDNQYIVHEGDIFIPASVAKQNLNKLILPDSISFDRFKSTDALVLDEKKEFLNKSASETTNSNNADTIASASETTNSNNADTNSSFDKRNNEFYMNQSQLINPLEKQTKDGIYLRNLLKKILYNFICFYYAIPPIYIA